MKKRKNKWGATKNTIGRQTSGFGTDIPDLISENVINIKYLLENPDIERVVSESVEIKPGEHHSKSFVSEIGKIVKNNNILSKYVTRITSATYGPRGEIIIASKPNSKDHFITLYDKDYAPGTGSDVYAAKIEFHSKKKWEVIILTKILISQIKRISGYKIKIIE